MSQCLICSRDHRNSYACDSCVTTLVGDLHTLAWLADELTVTRTRQARLAGAGGRGAGTPLGYHLGAAKAYDALRGTLGSWVRVWTGTWTPPGSAADLALWIADQNLRHLVQVDQLAEDVRVHTLVAVDTINPDPDEQTYGVCGAELEDGSTCPAHLYGEPKADWVRCRKCQTQHPARARMQDLERRLRVLYFRPATLARLLPRLIERPVSASNIVNWAREGKPIKTGTETSRDGTEWTTYHCGDVIQVAVSTPKRDRTGRKAS